MKENKRNKSHGQTAKAERIREGAYRQRKYEELTFTDDFLFCKLLTSDKALCIELLEMILEKKVRDIVYSNGQQELKQTYTGKGVRLDVYLEDDADSVYDMEMQADIRGDIPKRSRYYQGMVDMNLICRGEPYRQLKKSYIIFVCTHDLFHGEGLPVYTFENRCREKPELLLGDEAYKVFLNAEGNMQKASPKLAALLKYLKERVATDAFTRKLEDEVRRAVEHREWRLEYMTLEQKYREKYEDGLQQGLEEGLQQGELRSRRSTARRLSAMQLTSEQIAQAVGENVKTVVEWLSED